MGLYMTDIPHVHDCVRVTSLKRQQGVNYKHLTWPPASSNVPNAKN